MRWQGRDVRELQIELVVRRLADVKAATGGFIPGRELQAARHVIGLSHAQLKRRVRNYEASQQVTSSRQQATFADQVNQHDVLVALFQHAGCVSKAHLTLSRRPNFPKVNVRTLERYVKDRLDPGLVAASKKGYAGLVEQQLFNTEARPHRGYAYCLDPKELPLHVVLKRGWHPIQPHLTAVTDMATRYILAYLLTAGAPSTDDLITLLADAVALSETADGVVVGGKPQFVRSDRGGQFISDAWGRGLLRLECEQQLTDPYSSWQNGIAERINRRVDTDIANLPGYFEGGFGAKEQRVLKLDVPESSLLTFDQLDTQIGCQVTTWNNTPNRALQGQTPTQAWAADKHPLVEASRDAVLLSMLHRVKRVVQGDGVQLDYAVYNHPKLQGHKREVVELGYFKHRREHVEVFADGKHICRAELAAAMPRHLQIQVVQNRKRTVEKFRQLTAEGLRARVIAAREALIEAGVAEDELPEIPVFTTPDGESAAYDEPQDATVAAQMDVVDRALSTITIND